MSRMEMNEFILDAIAMGYRVHRHRLSGERWGVFYRKHVNDMLECELFNLDGTPVQ